MYLTDEFKEFSDEKQANEDKYKESPKL